MGSMRKSRLSPYKQDRLSRSILFRYQQRELRPAFAVWTARQQPFIFSGCAKLSPMNWKLKAESEAMFGEEIEVDESYFGGRRKGKRGCDAAGKIPVFGLLKRGGKVYT